MKEPHPNQGQTVLLNEKANDPQRGVVIPGAEFWVQGWYVNMDPDAIEPLIVPRNWAEKWFVMRAKDLDLPRTELVYGKIGHLGHIVHVSELGEVVRDAVF